MIAPEEQKPDFQFPKKERLKSRKSIEELFKSGRWLNAFPVSLVWQKTNHEDGVPVKMGVSVSKRKFKRATDRNRIKRLMREAYRLNKSELITFVNGSDIPGIDMMFIFSHSEKPQFQTVETKIIGLLERLKKDLKQ